MDGAGKRSGNTQCIPVDLYIHICQNYANATLLQNICYIFGATAAPLRLGEKKYTQKRGM